MPTDARTTERIRKLKEERYRRLRAEHYAVFDRCVASASAVVSNHDLDTRAAAAIEDALVGLAIDMLEAPDAE